MEITKYDIFNVNLNPKKGHAQAGFRPCVVIQNNIFNKFSPTVVVIPLTTNQQKIFPSEFIITPSKINGLGKPSRFLGSQIITVDRMFFIEKLGVLESKYRSNVKDALEISIDFEDQF